MTNNEKVLRSALWGSHVEVQEGFTQWSAVMKIAKTQALMGLVVLTQDVTYLIFLLVYGVDGCLTICHRILLHDNLGEAHRKHAYQLMANELKIGQMKVSLVYVFMQLAVSFGFIYLCPNTVAGHWGYLVGTLMVLAVVYVLFKKKYYHLHEEYLEGLRLNIK